MAGEAPFSVVIPAHNEEAVIARCLEALYRDAPADALPQVIVATNGCTDRTIEIARRAAPQAIVLDLPVGSKILAMNEGGRHATVAPRFILDADIVCDYQALRATADALREPGVMAASPALRMNLAGCDRFVRSYYKVWVTQPYIRDRLVGSGVFGLSEEGLRIMGDFPDTYGDDIWVRTRFDYDQRRNVGADAQGRPVFFLVSPPRTLKDHVVIEARRLIGLQHVRKNFASTETSRRNGVGSLGAARREGATLIDIATYIGMKTAAKLLFKWKNLRGRNKTWIKDVKARQQQSA